MYHTRLQLSRLLVSEISAFLKEAPRRVGGKDAALTLVGAHVGTPWPGALPQYALPSALAAVRALRKAGV